MLFTILLYKALIALAVFAVALVIAMYSTWGERKVAAWMQDRVGPDRAGPFGLFQPLADGGKMLMKEEFIPGMANKWLFILGPCISMFVANISSVVIPWARPTILADGTHFNFQISDINIGRAYIHTHSTINTISCSFSCFLFIPWLSTQIVIGNHN